MQAPVQQAAAPQPGPAQATPAAEGGSVAQLPVPKVASPDTLELEEAELFQAPPSPTSHLEGGSRSGLQQVSLASTGCPSVAWCPRTDQLCLVHQFRLAEKEHGCWATPTWCRLLIQTSHACFVTACNAQSACCSPSGRSCLRGGPASECSPVSSCRTMALAAPCQAPPLPRGPARCRLGVPARQSRSPQDSPPLDACPRKWDRATLRLLRVVGQGSFGKASLSAVRLL